MALRTVLNLTGSSQWRPVASEMLYILNMNRVQDAVVCESLNDLLRMCRNYEQQVIIWPSLPKSQIISKSVGCVNNMVFINQFTPYQVLPVYIPNSKQRVTTQVINILGAHAIWPINATDAEKTAWLDRLVRFSQI